MPLGLFPRLVVKFLQWCTKEGFRPLYKHMYKNLVRFPIHPIGFSVILLCHSSSVEIAIHRDPSSASGKTNVAVGRMVRHQLDSILERMGEEFFWLKAMEYELCVLCPVCCKRRSVSYCYEHHTSACDKEECLHFWSESELRDEQFCMKDTFVERTVVPLEEFVPWFEFLGLQVLLVWKIINFKHFILPF